MWTAVLAVLGLGWTWAGSCTSLAPISYWPADATTLDAIGSNNGMLINGAGFSPGRIGQAFSLNGQGTYVEVQNSPSLNPTGSFSIVAWILSAG